MLRLRKIVLGAAILLPVALYLSLAIGHRIPIELPRPTGTYPVGRTIYQWSNSDKHREVVAWIWYPAAPDSNLTPTEYRPSRWRAAIEEAQGYVMGRLFTRDLALIRSHSTADVPVAPTPARFPVVILRAGGSALTADFTSLAEDLASHGYVVAGIDAPYRSSVVVLSDGRVIRRSAEETLSEGLTPSNVELAGRLLKMWTEDVCFLVDRLTELNAAGPAERFAGRLDVTRVGAFGHSFGGATALQFCREDARCVAAMDIDGIPFGSVIRDGLPKPAMFLLSDHGALRDAESRKVVARINAIQASLPAGELPLYIRAANHFNFSDQMFQKVRVFTAIFQLLQGGIERYRAIAITTAYVHTFFDAYLKNEAPEQLRVLRQKFPEVRALGK